MHATEGGRVTAGRLWIATECDDTVAQAGIATECDDTVAQEGELPSCAIVSDCWGRIWAALRSQRPFFVLLLALGIGY